MSHVLRPIGVIRSSLTRPEDAPMQGYEGAPDAWIDVHPAFAFEEIRRRLMAREASDGSISDLGPQLCLWFEDPDGMHAEVCWIRDGALRGFHAPRPVAGS